MTKDPTPANTLVHQFVTTPGMVAVIDGALAAAISGIALGVFLGPGMVGTIPVGLVTGAATTAVLMWSSVLRGRRVMATWESRFPMRGSPGRLAGDYWGGPSAIGRRQDGGGDAGT
jgi:hypothetical protein